MIKRQNGFNIPLWHLPKPLFEHYEHPFHVYGVMPHFGILCHRQEADCNVEMFPNVG